MNRRYGTSAFSLLATTNCEQSDGAPEKPKILVIATQKTILAARISMALADAGFLVATLTPRGHPVRRLRKIQDHFAYGPRLKSIVRAINRWSPDLLVCTDDLAVRKLQALHRRIAASDDDAWQHISELIELSLGPATSFPAMDSKSVFLTFIETEGLRFPRTIFIPADLTFDSVPADLNYPLVVKADHSYGGMCVRIVNRDADVRAAVWEFQTPTSWRNVFRRVSGAILRSEVLAPLRLRLRRTISLQQYILGRPGNRAVICWKGKVLAGVSVEVLEVTHERGPGSVVRIIEHSEMAKAAEHIVKRLDLSGFVGFDFVLDSSDHAWIIEMNPRVTPICHFSIANGTNLAGSLYTQMKGMRPAWKFEPITSDMIALFPNEVVRYPSSEHLRSCHHDVPWNEPEVVCSVLDQALRTGVFTLVRTFLERYFPALIDLLVKRGLAAPRRDS